MNAVSFLLFAITLNTHTGEELSRRPVATPYETLEACQKAQVATGTQRPDGDRITVYSCVLLRGDQQT